MRVGLGSAGLGVRVHVQFCLSAFMYEPGFSPERVTIYSYTDWERRVSD